MRQKWSKFDRKCCLDKFAKIDLSELANTFLEDEICKVLDSEAPMGATQVRTRYLKCTKP